MNPHITHPNPIAARDAGGAGAAWLDSGITPGMVVVAGAAVGLLTQSRAAHH